MTDRLLRTNSTLRMFSLTLWLVLGLVYRDIAPWWTIAGPFALHAFAMAGFIWLTRSYDADPQARALESWRRLYIIFAGMTGAAYGGGGAMLVTLPPLEPRMLVAVALCVSSALAPGRLYEQRSYAAFAGLTLGLLAGGLLLVDDPLGTPMAVGVAFYLMALMLQNRPQYITQRDQVALSIAHEDLARRHAAAESDARAARDTLDDALESMPVALALWGTDDRLVMCNQAYRDRLQNLPDAISPGIRFADSLRTATYGTHFRPIGKEEAFIDQAMALYRNGGSSEYRGGPDLWLRGETRRTARGRRVTSIVDKIGRAHV